ncbi:hypothetical protein [Sorangium sp. So ce542]|uniref:hypothetical protein n=1 Tax=Sorangium sp. So ce542 TaxID=3133316 RepID=UPI003F619F85
MNKNTRRRRTWAWIGLLLGVVATFVVGRELRTAQEHDAPPTSSVTPARRADASAAGRDERALRRGGPPSSEAPATVAAVAAVAAEEPHVIIPVYHPRPATEWQGMLVDVAHQASCESTEHCGLAMVCHEGRCGPCTSDAECARGEGCVLDHCVPEERIECRKREDCGSPTKVCALSGYSPDPRSNQGMRAYCLDELGGMEQVRTPERDKKPAAVDPQRKPALEHQLLDLVAPNARD